MPPTRRMAAKGEKQQKYEPHCQNASSSHGREEPEESSPSRKGAAQQRSRHLHRPEKNEQQGAQARRHPGWEEGLGTPSLRCEEHKGARNGKNWRRLRWPGKEAQAVEEEEEEKVWKGLLTFSEAAHSKQQAGIDVDGI